MSDFDNPFADSSVQDASRPIYPPVYNDFNPFAQQNVQQPVVEPVKPAASAAAPVSSDLASLPPPPAAYTSWENSAAAEDLRRRQEELERKAAELERREQEMQRNLQHQARINNFPPLPSWCPVQPCFYQDVSIDIPMEFQKLVYLAFYFWIAYSCLLLLNIIGSLAYFIASKQHQVPNSSGVTFGMSLLFFILFVPCSFICWFRPVYNAFQKDSSFNFFLFFFIFFFQFCVLILQCIGVDGWGTVGFLTSLSLFSNNAVGAKAAGAIMFIIGIMFALAAAVNLIILMKVHRIYRSTGASFAKAQQEFSQGVLSNRAVQQTVGNAAASAARGAFEPPPNSR
jgi:hypothetical protein